MKRSGLGRLAILLASGLAAATVATVAFADTTIRMWTFVNPQGTGGREKVLRQLIDEFEKAHPGVKIQVETQIWQQISDKFFAAHQTGTAPDVTTLMQRRVMEGEKLGALANLDDLFVRKWTPQEIADIDGPLWRYASTPQGHYQITHWISTRGFFYRKDLFAAAGIDPASLTTWDKLIAAARKLTVKDDKGNVVRWGLGQSYPTDGANLPVMGNVVLDEQGDLFDKDGKANWATPAGVKGLTLQVDMTRKYHVTPDTAISLGYEDLYDQFNAGRYAMITGGVTRIQNAMKALGADKVGYLRTPTFDGKHYAPAETIGWSMAVWSGSPNKELAGEWLEFISSPHADTLWSTVAGMIPIRKSTIANNPQFFSRPENAYIFGTVEDMRNGWLSPPNAAGGFNDDLNRAGQDVLVNGTDPETALRKAEDEYNRRSD
jgi:multiple sugar transport system substrate-binding protein